MTKLKTLKDLKLKPKIIELPNGKTSVKVYPIIAELRQEAIKWIKSCTCKYNECRACSRFRLFHNITEEDLK